jgi:hypothetical protein
MRSVATRAFAFQVFPAQRTYNIVSAIEANGAITIVGSVDGNSVSISVSIDSVNQAFAMGGSSAVRSLLAPLMLAAASFSSVEVPLGSFTQ